MKKKKNLAVQILAVLALVWIVISIIGTALLVLTSNNTDNTQTVTAEQLQELIDSSDIEVVTQDWEVLETTDLESDVVTEEEEILNESTTIEISNETE